MVVRSPRAAATWTGFVALALAVIAVGELLSGGQASWSMLQHHWPPMVVAAVVAVLFALTELALVHIEFRHEASSYSLSGIPLVLGLLTCPPAQLVVARVVGALIAFAVQRPAPGKVFYNTCAYAFEAATVATLAHAILPANAQLDLRTAVVCYVVVACVDILMSLLVVIVISLHGPWLSREEIAKVLGPAALFSAASTGFALVAALLMASGPLGQVLLVVGCSYCVVLYRGYLARRRRHQSMAVIHDFVEQGAGVYSLDEMAARLLARLLAVLRAEDVELVIADGHDPTSPTTRMGLGESGEVVVRRGAPVTADWLLLRVTATGEPVLLARNTRDDGLRGWLATQGVRDAIVMPMPGAGDELALVITGRLGETATFTDEDVTLARTLAGHLAVAMHGTRVVERLRHDARHDTLTGLPNRALLSEHLRLALTPGSGGSCAVLLLDLDRFKEVNDALGHHVGDELLRVVAARLRRAVPASATVARLGGDEFAVLLPARKDTAEHADRVADHIDRVLAEPVVLADALVSTGASIGIAVATAGLSESDMLRHADTAMYAAKACGHPVWYSDELDQGRAERLAMLADLHAALERDELELRFQPQLDLSTGSIASLEALVRWRHPTLGVLDPDAFIPLAESTGLIHPLTDVVLRKALRQCRDWSDAGLDVTVAVNLSARSVDSSLPEKIGAALADAGLPAQRLILEITESAVMNDPDRAVPILRRVAAIGVALSLDDFGTGYSSLSYLQRLPVQEVKIDRSFVSGLAGPASSRASEALIRSIITISENLGLRTVAEGVEDAATLDTLRRLGCHLAQGYHIGRPGTPEQLATQLGALLGGLDANPGPPARPLRSVAIQ